MLTSFRCRVASLLTDWRATVFDSIGNWLNVNAFFVGTVVIFPLPIPNLNKPSCCDPCFELWGVVSMAPNEVLPFPCFLFSLDYLICVRSKSIYFPPLFWYQRCWFQCQHLSWCVRIGIYCTGSIICGIRSFWVLGDAVFNWIMSIKIFLGVLQMEIVKSAVRR